MRTRLFLAIGLALLTVSVSAQTVVCEERSWPDVTICTRDKTPYANCTGQADDRIFYVDNDPCQPECSFSVWVYEETNGYEGLQRKDVPSSDEHQSEWLKDDTCDGLIQPDTLIF